MQSKKFHPSILLTLSIGLILILSTVTTARVWGQERWPLYLPIVLNQPDLTPPDPGEQVTPEVPGGEVPPDASATPDASPTPDASATLTPDASATPNAVETRSPGIPEPATSTPEPGVTPTRSGTTTMPNTPTATAQSAPGATPTATRQSSQAPYSPPGGLWLTEGELNNLPTSGSAWDNLKSAADENASTPDLSDQDSSANVQILAKALVYARTGQTSYRNQVVDALRTITDGQTESGGRTLALGRELAAYVIAADLIDLQHVDSNLDGRFRSKLRELLSKRLDGDTLRETHELRPNNWGTHAGASRAAIAVYLGDQAELERTAQVFHGWLGDISAYNGFNYNSDLSWQANPSRPVGINSTGATKDGHRIDGALPEEMRRGGSFRWPPASTNYAWEGLQGAFVQAEILARAGYPVYEWEDRAMLRAVEFLYSINWPAESDDEWMPWMVNKIYGTNFPTATKAHAGKNMGWTDWTHGN